jgi:hypothetical protein
MKQALSLTDLESYDPGAKRFGNERRFLCDDCGDKHPRDDAHRSLAVNTATGAYICHRCKKAGLIKENWTKQPFVPRKARAAAALSRFFGLEPLPTPDPKQTNISEREQREKQRKLERLQSQMKQFQTAFENSPAQDYLQQRGIAPATAKAFGCGYAAAWEHWAKDDEGRFFIEHTDERVVFPITDPDGNVLAIHGRAIDDNFIDTPKKTKGSRKEALFQTANDFDADVIFVCEGPADAMALHVCGFAAVASVATSIPSWLPNRLAFRKVMVALDADETGDRDAEKHISELRAYGARAVRLRPEGAKDWNEILMNAGANALRRFVEEKTAAAFPDYELAPTLEVETAAEDFVIEDVFDSKNKSGQRVIAYLFEAAKNHQPDELLLGMPTVRAYQAGKELVAGVGKHSKGELTDAQLKALTDRFINAHLRSDDILGEWAGKDVPLFHLTPRSNEERLKNLTCNKIQSWIIREFWLRQNPKTEIDTMNL